MTTRALLVFAAALAVVPAVALAGVALADAVAQSPSTVLAAGVGAFLAGVVRDGVTLVRHVRTCPARRVVRAVSPQEE